MKKYLTIAIIVLITNIAAAQVSKTIIMTSAGALSSLLSAMEKTTVTNLTVSGNINATDISCMNLEMPVLAVVDISAANIVSPANAIPEFAFSDPMYWTGKATLKTIILPNSLISIGNGAFFNCIELTNITIPNSVIYIEDRAFINCAMINMTIPNSIPLISRECFFGCGKLASLTIGSSVTTIEDYAFTSNTALKTIISLNPTPPTIEGTQCFFEVNPTAIYVPISSVAQYKGATGWSAFPNIYEYILRVTTNSVSSIKLSSAVVLANLDLIVNTPVVAHGLCWNTTGSPTVADNKINNGAKTTLGAFSNTISGLSQNTTYYVKAYATDGERTVYGNELSFTTMSIPEAAGIISGASSVCQGQNSVVYIVPPIGYATSYIWTLPTGATGTSNTNSITVNYSISATAGNITVKGHNEWGDGVMSSLAIIPNLLPASAGIISGKTSVCQGENSITYTIPAIEYSTSYVWTLPTGVTGTSKTNSIIVNFSKTAVSGNISVLGHNDCGDGVAVTLAITVNQLPEIYLADKSINCGDIVSLNATTNYSGSGTLTYHWSPSTGLNDAAIADPLASITVNSTYTVTVTTPNGCVASGNLNVIIMPMSNPEIGIVGVGTSNKNRVVWNKQIANGIESYYIYRETNVSDVFEKIGSVPYDSISVFTDNKSDPNVKSNRYKISILDRCGLESPLSNPHRTIHLSINKGINNIWNLIWESYEGFTASTYNIYRGTNASNLNFIDATSGSSTQYTDLSAPAGDVYYQLEVISPNLISPSKSSISISSQKSGYSEDNILSILESYSSSRSNVARSNLNAINELEGENNKIKIYPNPVNNELRIDFEGGTTFEILNLMGQLIFSGEMNKGTTVNTSSFTSGVYLIKFKTGNTFEYKRIIKE